MSTPKKTRYTLIKGAYWIHSPDKPRQGPQPDGDTVSFAPDSLDLVLKLPRFSGRAPAIHPGDRVNVRYEGIDALETHFPTSAGSVHQDLNHANAARDRNLALLGFTNVRFFPDLPNVVQSVDQNPLPGYVLANGIESNGRLLGLVYAGTTRGTDGSKVYVDEAKLDRSVNARLVMDGLAYVEPYDTMPMALVRHLRILVHSARSSNKGLWPGESPTTAKAATIASIAAAQTLIMWPKLFRRLAKYFAEGLPLRQRPQRAAAI